MNKSGITILGLGPGDPMLLTRQAWQVIEKSSEIFLRTQKHPVVQALPDRLILHSFDELYNTSPSFEDVYEAIVSRVIELGRRPEGVIYAVPGHPLVAETTTLEIIRRAGEQDLPVCIIEGLSFIEPTLTALKVDPLPHTAIVDALEVSSAHIPPFPTSAPALIAQIHSRAIASDLKLTLMSLYPDDHPVRLVHAAGTSQQQIDDLALFEIDRIDRIGLQSVLYLPPLAQSTSFESFLEVIAHLRASDGCPWDREQTHQSLRASLLEEMYEALAAIDADDAENMQEEFGDLILLILMQTQIASELGEFNIGDVLHGVNTKIVRRHPHVFGDLKLEDEEQVLQNWERLKAEERRESGNAEKSLLDGVSAVFPALIQAQVYQKRAARVGFDWPTVEGVKQKLQEELGEVDAAVDEDERSMEIGDLLFAVVNLARWYGIDAESALRLGNNRFYKRFSHIEKSAHKRGLAVSDLSLDEMEQLWQEAKRL